MTGKQYKARSLRPNLIELAAIAAIVVLFCWLAAFAVSVISRYKLPTPPLPNTPTVQAPAPRYFPRYEPMKDGDYKI